jgi:hypothetical protein
MRAKRRPYPVEALAMRLGDAIREGETVGLPYAVDDIKPKAKPSRNPAPALSAR